MRGPLPLVGVDGCSVEGGVLGLIDRGAPGASIKPSRIRDGVRVVVVGASAAFFDQHPTPQAPSRGGVRWRVRELGSDRSAGRAGTGIDPYFQQCELPVAALLESFARKRRPGNVAAEPWITLCVAWPARSGPEQREGPLKVPARWPRSLG